MEIVLIFFFILMFFGAKSIPGLARTLGKGMREIQNASDDIKREIRATGNEIKKDLALGDDVKKVIADIEAKPKQLLDQIELDVQNTKRDIDTKLNKIVEQADITKTIDTEESNNEQLS
jgi:sec-independent protein translocase protein TatA